MKHATNQLIQLDHRFLPLLKKHGYPTYKKNRNYLQSLIRSIIYQQLSGKSARKIYERFLKLNNPLSPHSILKTDIQLLKNIGLSKQKINYIFNICDYSLNNDMNTIDNLDNKSISQELKQIKGIGQWTVDMFLMFSLNRMDVFPNGDLGVKKGLMMLENLDKLPTEEIMNQCSQKWKPYRSIAAWYLWIILEGPFEW